MSDYSKHTKTELVKVLKSLEIHTLSKDTKKILIGKIDGYIGEHPEDGESTIQTLLQEQEDDDDEEEDEVTLSEESNGILIEEGEEDDDADEDAEEADADYQQGPPWDVRAKIIDPVIAYSEDIYAEILKVTDSIGITTLEYSNKLREQLSKTITLSVLELIIEVVYFIYLFVPLVALKNNNLNLQLLKDNSSFFAKSTLPTPELTIFFDRQVISTLLVWAINAIVLPLAISYYVNFSKRTVFGDDEVVQFRIFKFDPFIFALSKVVIHYLVNQNVGSWVPPTSFAGVYNIVKNYALIELGVYGQFAESLGNFPLVVGVSNVLIALYSQFEDF